MFTQNSILLFIRANKILETQELKKCIEYLQENLMSNYTNEKLNKFDHLGEIDESIYFDLFEGQSGIGLSLLYKNFDESAWLEAFLLN